MDKFISRSMFIALIVITLLITVTVAGTMFLFATSLETSAIITSAIFGILLVFLMFSYVVYMIVMIRNFHWLYKEYWQGGNNNDFTI